MKRLVTLLMAALLTVTLCACSNPVRTATEVVESTTNTTVVLDDPSVLPSFVIYDANDNTQIALTLSPVYADWHYLGEDDTEQTITSGDATQTASETVSDTASEATAASGDASADTASSSGDASSQETSEDTAAQAASEETAASSADSGTEDASSGYDEAIVAASYLSLHTLDVDDDSEIYYNVDPGATPDRMEETSWKAEYIGSESADAMEVFTKLANFYSLPLKADRVYQVTVIWEEENFESVGYYGTLTYMFVTD